MHDNYFVDDNDLFIDNPCIEETRNFVCDKNELFNNLLTKSCNESSDSDSGISDLSQALKLNNKDPNDVILTDVIGQIPTSSDTPFIQIETGKKKIIHNTTKGSLRWSSTHPYNIPASKSFGHYKNSFLDINSKLTSSNPSIYEPLKSTQLSSQSSLNPPNPSHFLDTEQYNRAIKQHERMVRNRQAACMSRIRKKEYVERLETQLERVQAENHSLRLQNEEWCCRCNQLESYLIELQNKLNIINEKSNSKNPISNAFIESESNSKTNGKVATLVSVGPLKEDVLSDSKIEPDPIQKVTPSWAVKVKPKPYIKSEPSFMHEVLEKSVQGSNKTSRVKTVNVSHVESQLSSSNKRFTTKRGAALMATTTLLMICGIVSLNLNAFIPSLSGLSNSHGSFGVQSSNNVRSSYGRVLLGAKPSVFESNKEPLIDYKNMYAWSQKETKIFKNNCSHPVTDVDFKKLSRELNVWMTKLAYSNESNKHYNTTFRRFNKLKFDTAKSSRNSLNKKIMNKINHSRPMNPMKAYASSMHSINGQQIKKKVEDLHQQYTGVFDRGGRLNDTIYFMSLKGKSVVLPALNQSNESRSDAIHAFSDSELEARIMNEDVFQTNKPKFTLILPAEFNMDNKSDFDKPANSLTLMQIDCEVVNFTMRQVDRALLPKNV